MAKFVAFACVVLSPMMTFADGWKPPENPDPFAILQEAKADAQKRDYKTALEKQVWYHQNALKYQVSQTGVRLSFALGYWLDLAKVYPPALDRLREIRDEAEAGTKKGISRVEAVQEVAAIDRTLGEEAKTVDLFLEFDKNDPKFAARVFSFAQPALLEAKQ